MRAEREWPSALTRRLALVSQVFANALARSDADVALREVTGRLINAQEKERARLAQELHDGMSQQLAVLAVELQLLGLRPPANSTDLRARLDELSDKTKALSSDVHRMSHALHPAKLERLGLVAAIGGFCRELDAAGTVRTRFQAEAIPDDIPRDRAWPCTASPRRRSGTCCGTAAPADALVTLRGVDSELVLRVADDGCGFDPASVSAGGSLGLLGMRERIGVFGGQIEWHTGPGQGTEVRAQMPLPARTTS
jgi:signal transduction histidine kinase